MKWDEIQRAVMEFERKGPMAQEEIDDLSNNERRKNIKSLGKYGVKDFFYRVEFQL